MATYTPPPYFPQGSLAPPDQKRYRKFKLIIALICVILLVVLGVASVAVWYLVKSIF
jgi:hypothetical protein